MRELTKSIARRTTDSRFLRTYFVGEGIDIGGAPDPLSLYTDFFPLMKSVKVWDMPDGDAEIMESVNNETYDFVHSSHCLEHLQDPIEGIKNWFRILKPGGHLIVTVPEEDLYEQGIFPSTFNFDHKWTFTIYKESSWSLKSINVLEMLSGLGSTADIRLIGVEDRLYRYSLPRFDQTSTPIAESAIEFIIRKRLPVEVQLGGRNVGKDQPPARLLVYYNQYGIDYARMKEANFGAPPFRDESDL
jgi:SAM-dependent methyltransferase